MGEKIFQMFQRSGRPAAAMPKCYRFNQVCGIDTMDRENPIRMSHIICHWTRYHQGARRQDMHDSHRDLCHIAIVLAQTL